MQIYRAEDGEAFQVDKSLRDIEQSGSLEGFLHGITDVDESAVLAYLSDGRRLRDENIRELVGAADQSIFVFNKHNLDYGLEDVVHRLRVYPPLHPEVMIDDSRHIEVVATTGSAHYDSIEHIFNTIQVQHEALLIASTSLDLNVLSVSDAFEGFAGGGRRELQKQAQLLQGLDLDLEVIGKIRIHSEFLSPAVRKAVEAGEKARTLGDYVSNVKMRQVGDACAKTHHDLRGRFDTADESMTRLSSGADDVRASIVNSGLVEEAEVCMKRSQEALERITEIRAQMQEPRTDAADLLTELRKEDTALRDEVQFIVNVKNKSTALCMKALRQISHLHNDLMFLPPTLSNLQSDFRAKTNFAHIQRLHNMLYAYGATLVEIVRRKEFSRFFSHRAQTIAEIMAKLSSSERKRRQIYRGEVHGQLPFDTKGLDDSVPAMEITSTGINNHTTYSIEREDLMALLDEVDRIDQAHWTGDNNNNDLILHPLRETRSALEKLINRMDNLETTFDKMAEKTIFSASRISLPRRQATDHTDNEFQEVVEQLHELQDLKDEQERMHEEDRHGLQAEIDRLRLELRDANDQTIREQQRTAQLEAELRHEQAQGESEATARRILEQGHAELLADMGGQRKALADAETDAMEHTRVSEALRQELAKATSDFKEVQRLDAEKAEQMIALLSEKEVTLRSLNEARIREQVLEAQIETAHAEVEIANREAIDIAEEKDRQLRAQGLEADRTLRDVIAEADGDRAVLERQCFELKALLETTERRLKESRVEVDVSNENAAGLREELQRAGHELKEVRNVEIALRNELRSSQSALVRCQERLEESERLAKELLRVAAAFRESHGKAFAAAQATSSSSSKSVANLADSTPSLKPFVEPPPINPEDLAEGLRILSEYDLATFNDTVAKTSSTIRKWQKQCKEYRDRAKGKISFRNFAKGDLALFLPTRNSVSKPWAAFNVSFPHYFLQAAGNLAEQLKTREWIVARITSITEQVADNRDPSSNPYSLGDGTKFYMLQVEDWTQSSSSTRRKASPPKPNTLESPYSPSTLGPDISDPTVDSITSPSETLPKLESSLPTPRHLLGPRQRTHSAPAPHPSSLSRLLAQAPPPIAEVKERTSPSPPRLPSSRPSSPLAGPSHTRASSSLVSPPHSRPSSPLANPPLARPSSPLAVLAQPRPSSPLTGPPYARPSPPLSGPSYVRPASPLAGSPQPRPSSSLIAPPLAGLSPSHASPKSATSPLQGGSRRSSSSSRPSSSSVFSAGRHPFTLSSSAPKAAPTTALSDPSRPIGISPPAADSLSSRSRDDLPAWGTVTPSPEGSPGEGMSSVLLARRRTTSASVHGLARSSPLSSPTDSYQQPQSASSGPLASLANSWGAAFGRKNRAGSVRQSTGGSSNSSATATARGASDILKRFDDILPQERERGSR